jgi:predicted MFS family arabinose efflux permease
MIARKLTQKDREPAAIAFDADQTGRPSRDRRSLNPRVFVLALATAARLAPPDHKGRALSASTGGISVAWLVGVPSGAVIVTTSAGALSTAVALVALVLGTRLLAGAAGREASSDPSRGSLPHRRLSIRRHRAPSSGAFVGAPDKCLC